MNELRINRNLARWILLGLGIIALIVMAVALLVAPLNKFDTVSYVALGVGILGLAGFVLLDPRALVASITGRTSQYGITTVLMSLMFIVVVVALFIVVRAAKIEPWDVTQSQKYKLSQQSIDLLANLQENIHVVGFYTEQDMTNRQEAETWLKQYERYSNGKLTYEFVDPDINPLLAQQLEMTRAGVMVFSAGEQHAEASFADESTMTGAVVRVMSGEARKLYMTTGHGERAVDDFSGAGFSQAKTLLGGFGFEVEPLNLLEKGSVPEDATLVMVAGPVAQFAPTEVEALKAYLDAGGAALFMFDPATGGGQFGKGVESVAFNHTGSRLATAGADGVIRVWEVGTGDQLREMRGHSSDVVDVVYSADGRQLASAGQDGTVRVWDAATSEPIKQLEGSSAGVLRLAYSSDDRLLVGVGTAPELVGAEETLTRRSLIVWDAQTLEPVSDLFDELPLVDFYAVAFSPDSSLLAAGAVDGTIYVWKTDTGEEVVKETVHTNTVWDLAFSADGATLHSVAVDGTEGTLNVATGQSSAETLYPNISITGLAITEDGTKIYSLADGTIHIRAPEATSTDQDVVLSGHSDLIWSMALSPDGTTFATGSQDSTARIWDVDSATNLITLKAQAGGDPLIGYLKDSWGIQVDDDVVIDLATASNFNQVTPVIYNFERSSPIVQSLDTPGEYVIFAVARSLQPVDPAPADITLTSLLFSSGEEGASWGETNSQAGSQFDPEDVPGPVTMGVSAENTASKARIVVYGDADFASDQGVQQYGNSDLLMKTANWLTEKENLIDIPAKDVGSNRITKPLSETGLKIFYFTSICLVPLIGLVAGAVVWLVRRRRR